MAKKLNNYKLYITGIDAEKKPVLLTFIIYGMESVKSAEQIVRTDKKHVRVLHHYKLNKHDARFRSVKCDDNGIVLTGDAGKETDILCTFPGRTSVSYTGEELYG